MGNGDVGPSHSSEFYNFVVWQVLDAAEVRWPGRTRRGVCATPTEPTPAAIERAARAADECFHSQPGDWEDTEARAEFWRNVVHAVSAALTQEPNPPERRNPA